jgi:predicted DNA-binding ribbon-helix-helix protein
MQTKTLYDQDFNRWLATQIQALQEGQLNELDPEHLIEELESLSKSDKRALTSYLKVLVMHKLKWQYQPRQCSNSWMSSINNARFEISLILEDSPSLGNYLPEALAKAFPPARKEAAQESGIDLDSFPETCSYSLEELLGDDFQR